MKQLRYTLWAIAAAAIALGFTSCSDDDDQPSTDITVNLSQSGITYDADGVWADCYTYPSTGALNIDGVLFSHDVQDFGDIKMWDGFCPSRVDDTADYPEERYLHQFASITGGGVAGPGTPYLVAYYNSYSTSYSTTIRMPDGSLFNPQSLWVTNTTYAYYEMLLGSSFANKFEGDDTFTLTISGVNEGGIVGSVDVKLASGTDILYTWKKVDLSGMGMVEGLVFTLASTDTDTATAVMNTPAYFCLDNFTYRK